MPHEESEVKVVVEDRAPSPILAATAGAMVLANSTTICAKKGFQRPALLVDGLLHDLEEGGFGRRDIGEDAHRTIGAIELPTGLGLSLSPFNLDEVTFRLRDYENAMAHALLPKGNTVQLADYVRGLKTDNDYLGGRVREMAAHLLVVKQERDAAEEKCAELQKHLLSQPETLQMATATLQPIAGIAAARAFHPCCCAGAQAEAQAEKRFRLAVKKDSQWEFLNNSTPMVQGEVKHHLHNALRAYGVDRVQLLEVAPFKADLNLTF